jgi:hypothetical protein
MGCGSIAFLVAFLVDRCRTLETAQERNRNTRSAWALSTNDSRPEPCRFNRADDIIHPQRGPMDPDRQRAAAFSAPRKTLICQTPILGRALRMRGRLVAEDSGYRPAMNAN